MHLISLGAELRERGVKLRRVDSSVIGVRGGTVQKLALARCAPPVTGGDVPRLSDKASRLRAALRAALGVRTERDQPSQARLPPDTGPILPTPRLLETKCRVTGVENMKHLRASHIKPWAVADDHEKLDGANGLLLSPHVDHLFDRGFISFDNSGEILVSRDLNPVVLQQWSIRTPTNVGSFRKEQQEYLEYHRDAVFVA